MTVKKGFASFLESMKQYAEFYAEITRSFR